MDVEIVEVTELRVDLRMIREHIWDVLTQVTRRVFISCPFNHFAAI